jgi:copper homeostasis protein
MPNTSGHVLLEVCIASVDDSVTAAAGGADRLELNAALALGGLTPSAGSIAEIRRAVDLPVVVMIRPRAGGFCYSAADFIVMRRDVDAALAHGVAGVAFGVLTEGGHVDVPRCRQLLRQIATAEAVFHRAFDLTPEPAEALEQLIDLGVRRVLTSGQAATALEGAALIAKLIAAARGRIEILPAAGINAGTVLPLLRRTGCDQVHASLRTTRVDSPAAARRGVRLGSADEGAYEATDGQAVAEVVRLLRGQPTFRATPP